MGKKSKRALSWTLSFLLLFSIWNGAYAESADPANVENSAEAAAPESPQQNVSVSNGISGHWAEKELLQALDKGWIQGYADGSVQPDRSITRGEFIALINRSFGFSEEAAIDFKDLPKEDWQYKEVARAVKAAYIQGYADGTIGVKSVISREEAAVILARILQPAAQFGDGGAERFTDAASIAAWSFGAVDAIVAAKYMNGYGDNSYRPKAPITRAEILVTLLRAHDTFGTVVYDTPGVQGAAAGSQIVNKNVVVKAAGVTLQNMHINGDLLLDEAIGEGDVTLNNVTVKGKTLIKGGGANSIHVENSLLFTVVVNKKTGTVRIKTGGSSTVSSILLQSPAILEGSGFTEVRVSEELPAGSQVTLLGSFQNINVYALDIAIEIPEGKINELHVFAQATGLKINTGQKAAITRLVLEAAVKATGLGSIALAVIDANAKQSSFEKQPGKKEGSGVAPTSSGSYGSYSSGPSSTTTPTPTPTPPVPSSYTLVDNGVGNAVVVYAANIDQRVKQAASKIAKYVEQSTGAKLTVMSEFDLNSTNLGQKVPIYIGLDAQLSPELRSSLPGMDDEGFIIEANNGHIAIAGKTWLGTEHGIYEFLERYVGVRWLLPGTDGEDVPTASSLIVPHETVKQEPAFMSRILSPMTMPTNQTGAVQFEWAKFNRLPWNFNAFHSMYYIFPGEKFGSTNPEFYPTRNGQPYIPPKGDISAWQPCFSEAGTVQIAVYAAIQYFADNPDQTSFSLGVNDSGGFCEANPSHPNYPNKINSKGLVDMSDIYYNWVNQVAEQVLQVYPNKWFGVLAYENVLDPPSFQLNPRIVPMLTKDRMAWIDPAVKAADEQLMDDWKQVAATTGWYDYIYGTPYLVPRMYPHLMADNFLKAQELDVSVQYAEIYPNWGEGPKGWVTAKLMWDPTLNVDDLLQEWYERAVGEEAATDLAAYYELWEDFWTVRVQQSEWFQQSKDRIYMDFTNPSYLKLVTMGDISQSRLLLESALAKAVTVKQKARAALLLRAFEYYEASAISYLNSLSEVDPNGNVQDALESLFSEDTNGVWIDKRNQLLEEFKNDPVLLHPIDPSTFGLIWSSRNQSALFWSILNYLKQHEPAGGPVSDSLHAYTLNQDPKISEIAKTMERVLAAPPSLVENGSFESATTNGEGTLVPGNWVGYNSALRQHIDVNDPKAAHSGQASAAIKSHGDLGGPFQNISVKSGPFAARTYFRVPDSAVIGNGTIELAFHYILKNGSVAFFALRSDAKKLADYTAGDWVAIELFDQIPASVNGSEVDQVQLAVYLQNVPNGTEILVDDVTVYQSP
ncbi:DUF4838 domain-containing protein [Paenibacillus eucommiae]|uniref:SLH domain-containing protein n=1 Tax=Paenibacillus eucommiae TaxID=1355755 RepID=A0ABS4IU88_9BACL|nr:DUF4838 domain-containing protein [Paenibacillus eucommiae]MBP1990670.1 hypothetical protein [Paenibacillus eucommiae]